MIEINLPVYWICLAAGTVLLLASIVLGDLLDGVFDGLGVDIDVAGGGVMPPLLAFVALFGAGGLLGDEYALLGLPSYVTGIAFGSAGAIGAGAFFRLIRRSEAPPERGTGRLVGRSGRVTVAIEAGSTGEVELATRGTVDRFLATCAAGRIPAGAIVRVTGEAGSTLIVTPAAAGEGDH